MRWWFKLTVSISVFHFIHYNPHDATTTSLRQSYYCASAWRGVSKPVHTWISFPQLPLSAPTLKIQTPTLSHEYKPQENSLADVHTSVGNFRPFKRPEWVYNGITKCSTLFQKSGDCRRWWLRQDLSIDFMLTRLLSGGMLRFYVLHLLCVRDGEDHC